MDSKKFQKVARLDDLDDRVPVSATLASVELVVLRVGGDVSV